MWKPEKTSRLERDLNSWPLCDIGAVLYQLSYQAKVQLVTLWVRNMLVIGEDTSK